jgi:tRNA-2-methylthio-N6-dimethylallyladenosine synthase
MKYFIRTFGCQMNENDSEHIAGILARSGAARAASVEEADVIIVNTCAVREKSEEKLYSYLGRLSSLKKKRAVLIGVAGCVAQVYRDTLFEKRPFIDFVVGPDKYLEIPAILEKAAAGPCFETGRGRGWREFGHPETVREGATSAFVTVMEGCDKFCAYCVVPFSRGREKFRPFGNIVREVRDLAADGYKEIQFLGQNVNSYRDPESGRGFADLLDEASAVTGIAWVRFITSHPRNFGDDIIAAMARNPKVCRGLHLPLQSGSTAVLERMNRGYTRGDYLALVARLKKALPGILLMTDIIVGFPGETETDFEETCDALRELRFAGIFSFRYSPRPLTAAVRMTDDVPLEVKRRRLLALQNLQKTIQLEVNNSYVGRELEVLCLGRSPKGGGRLAGRTEGNLVVNFESTYDVIGQFVTVRITGCGPYSLHGQLAG